MLRSFFLIFVSFFIFSCTTDFYQPAKENKQQNKQQDKQQDKQPIAITPKQTKQTEIAILMPLSGESAEKGKKLSKLINMGLRDGGASNFNATIYDSNGNFEENIEEIKKKKTNLILGPLFSEETSNFVMHAKQNDIITISLSNNPTIADKDVFIWGHAPFKQTQRLINYMLKKHYDKFVLLLPDNEYTNNMVEIFHKLLNQQGFGQQGFGQLDFGQPDHNQQDYAVGKAKLLAVEKYTLNPESIERAVKRTSKLVDEINEDPYTSSKAVVYLVAEPEFAFPVFDSLIHYNLDKKAVVCGENKLDITYPKPMNMIFTGSLNILNSQLDNNLLRDMFGSDKLDFMDKLAYDLGLVVSFAIENDFNLENFYLKINNSKGYITTSGTVKFNNYISQRKYDIIERKGSSYKTIDRDNTEF